jgi:hypothetical protein
MNELTQPSSGGEEEEQVASLLRQAGPRPEVPAADLAAIKHAFRAEWREHLRRRVRRFPAPGGRSPGWRPWALAAALLAALGLGWWLRTLGPPAGAGLAARLEGLSGVVTARAPGAEGQPATRLVVGQEIPAGAELETEDAGEGAAAHAALRLAGGLSLRLDAASRVRLASASRIELLRGAVYVDSGGAPRRGRAVAIRTPFGVATEVGTQFEVRLLGPGTSAMRLRVREGEVRIEAEGAPFSGAPYSAAAGVELTLHADGSVAREQVAGHGSPWRWALAAAPPFEIEGRTLLEFLHWVGRETGWRIEYADPGIEAQAGSIVLHGGIGHLTPEEAPGVVLPGAGLAHRLADGVLIVSHGSTERR